MIVVWLFLAVPPICLQFVIVVLPDHTHYFLSKISFTTPIECQTVWIQIRPAILSSLILDQTVCKGYQQATKLAANKQTKDRIRKNSIYSNIICLMKYMSNSPVNVFLGGGVTQSVVQSPARNKHVNELGSMINQPGDQYSPRRFGCCPF